MEEAEQSLNVGETRSKDAIKEVGSEEFDRNEEVGVCKRTSVSALVGSLAGLPISLTQVIDNFEFILPSSAVQYLE